LGPSAEDTVFGIWSEQDDKTNNHWDGDYSKQPLLFIPDFLKIYHVPVKKDAKSTPSSSEGSNGKGIILSQFVPSGCNVLGQA